MRIYRNKLEQVENPTLPLIQIPLSAFEAIYEDFDHSVLALDNDDNSQQFIPNKFALKLRDDFLKLYLREEYSGVGFEEETLEHIKQYGFPENEDLQTFIEYYCNYETALYNPKAEFDREAVDEVNTSEEGVIIKNKMFIFACYEQESRDTYIHYFNLMAEHGNDWYSQHLEEIQMDQDVYADPEVDQQQVPNQD